MTKQEYSDYQKGVINNYYRNLDAIALGKLSELVSNHIMTKKDVQILAKNLNDWLSRK
jgi:hypothetical protein